LRDRVIAAAPRRAGFHGKPVADPVGRVRVSAIVGALVGPFLTPPGPLGFLGESPGVLPGPGALAAFLADRGEVSPLGRAGERLP